MPLVAPEAFVELLVPAQQCHLLHNVWHEQIYHACSFDSIGLLAGGHTDTLLSYCINRVWESLVGVFFPNRVVLKVIQLEGPSRE